MDHCRAPGTSVRGKPVALAYSAENCTLGRAMEILGDKWTILILREVFLGIRRFEDLRVRTAIPRQVLTNRLAVLVGQGILRRHPYQEPGERARDEYRLTEKGFDLSPVLRALIGWGDRYLGDADGPAVVFVHGECGAPAHIEVRCENGHRLTPRETVPTAGPGARLRRP